MLRGDCGGIDDGDGAAVMGLLAVAALLLLLAVMKALPLPLPSCWCRRHHHLSSSTVEGGVGR